MIRRPPRSTRCPYPTLLRSGLDDWAWKNGRTYGTICVDLERHEPIDLLPERTPEAVAAWLEAHPTIEVIARDRKSTRLNSSHANIPYAAFCLKKHPNISYVL